MQTLWIGNQPDPDDRTQITVSEEDQDRIFNSRKPFKVAVFDNTTQRTVIVADEDCGLGCRCALRFF